MNEGILGQIANPQLADIAGALDYRQSRIDKDEAKRKEIRRNQLIAQAIPNMAADSPLRKLFEEDPQAGAMIAKTLGIPLNEGEKFEQLRSRVGQLSMLAQNDPRAAYDHAKGLQAENQRNGVEDKNLDTWIAKVDEDPVTGFNALYVMNNSLNPVKEDVINAKDQAELDLKREEFEWKKANPNAGAAGGLSPKDVVMTPNGAYVFDKRTGGFSKGMDESGNPIVGAAYDAALQGNIAESKAGAAEKAKGNAGRYQEFINQGVTSAQALPTIKRSIDLLDSIETGGIDAARIKAKQMFGIESADEGELTYNLGKNVLSQLKDTFGSAFTAAEGERLATLEAGLGRNPESNKRILANALQTMQKKAERGIQAARDNGDEFSASDIESYMKMNLGKQPDKKTPKTHAAQETAAQRFARLKANAN